MSSDADIRVSRPTLLIVVGLVVAYWVFYVKPSPPPVPGPTDPPVVEPAGDAPQELLQLAATCQVLAAALDAGEFTDTAQVHEAWVYVDRHALNGQSLSPAAKTWASEAELRVQAALGQTGATHAATMTPELAAAAAAVFRELSDELLRTGKF